MRIIQILVLGIVILLTTYLLRGRSSHAGRAWKKIGLLMLFIAMVVTVLFPGLTDYVAYKVGAGSGVNLLIYGLCMAFLLFILNSYLHEQENKDSVTRLARQVALTKAKGKYKK